jgi:hypothetical protein
MALIVASIHYATLQRDASRNAQPRLETRSQWKMSGRTALQDGREVIGLRGKKLNR